MQWLAQARHGNDEPALGILMSWLLDRRKWKTRADHGACSKRARQHDADDHMLVQRPRVVQLLVGRGMGCVEGCMSKVASCLMSDGLCGTSGPEVCVPLPPSTAGRVSLPLHGVE